MNLFRKKCILCGIKINKEKTFLAKVKVPEFTDFREKPFCSKEHADQYSKEVTGTPRTNFCPSCGV